MAMTILVMSNAKPATDGVYFRGGARNDWVYVGWPFGRLRIGRDSLTLAVRFLWKTWVHELSRPDIQSLSVSRLRVTKSLLIEANVDGVATTLEFVPWRFADLRERLREFGYEIEGEA